MAYKIFIEKSAKKELDALDAGIKKRIIKYIDEVALLDNPRSRGKGLQANKSGLWRYRVGSYRIVCEIVDALITIVVVRISKRSDVYT